MTDETTEKPGKPGRRDTVLDSLVANYQVFRDATPLAIGIHKVLRERMPELSREQISRALKIHTASTRYLKSLSNAEHRLDLDGNPAGEITPEQREAAMLLVKERIKKAAERRKAEAERLKAEAQEQQRQAKLQQLAEKFSKR